MGESSKKEILDNIIFSLYKYAEYQIDSELDGFIPYSSNKEKRIIAIANAIFEEILISTINRMKEKYEF